MKYINEEMLPKDIYIYIYIYIYMVYIYYNRYIENHRCVHKLCNVLFLIQILIIYIYIYRERERDKLFPSNILRSIRQFERINKKYM